MSRPSFESVEARAEDRHFDAVIEAVCRPHVPVSEILDRVADRVDEPAQAPSSRWLVAAAMLLGVGVAVGIAVYAPRGPDVDSASPQDPEIEWNTFGPPTPYDEVLIDEPAAIDQAVGAKAVRLRFPLYELTSVTALAQTRFLSVAVPREELEKCVQRGGWGKSGTRLQWLSSLPALEVLEIESMPMAPADLAALGSLEKLSRLRLTSLIPPEDPDGLRLRRVVVPMDAAFVAELSKHSAAGALELGGAPIQRGALAVLAASSVRALALDAPTRIDSDALQEIVGVRTLEQLRLSQLHSVAIRAPSIRIDGRELGVRALTPEFLRGLAELPALQGLHLEHCALDPTLVSAMPRQLVALDVATCSGLVGTGFDRVLAEMPRLRSLGLPLPIDSFGGLDANPPTATGDELSAPTVDEARAWILAGSWERLRVRGTLARALANALSAQAHLRELEISPLFGSVPLDFVEALPRLRVVALSNVSFEPDVVAPLARVPNLMEVQLRNCQPIHADPRDILSDGPPTVWLR